MFADILVLVQHLSRKIDVLARQRNLPLLPKLVHCFLYQQDLLFNDAIPAINAMEVNLNQCPEFSGPIRYYPSAVAMFFCPSGDSGRYRMYWERIVQSRHGEGCCTLQLRVS